MTHINDLHVARTNNQMTWVGNVKVDFGNEVTVTYPFDVRPYEQDNLPDMTAEERAAYAETLAQEQLTIHADDVAQTQDAVDKGFYGVQG
jgi:hypothetical protein